MLIFDGMEKSIGTLSRTSKYVYIGNAKQTVDLIDKVNVEYYLAFFLRERSGTFEFGLILCKAPLLQYIHYNFPAKNLESR